MTFVNIILFFTLLFLLLITPATIKLIYKSEIKTDLRTSLNNVMSEPYGIIHFSEMKKLNTYYNDNYSWRRSQFSGETININTQGIRRTYKSDSILTDKNFIFMGGSTMWGTGSNDANTIPSLFSKKYQTKSTNFGEVGYIARQSLAFLINQYLYEKIDKGENYIISYDGVNDVHVGCREENFTLGSSRESEIRNTLQYANSKKFTFSYLFEPWLEIGRNLKRKIIRKEKGEHYGYICHNDTQRAEQVAKKLVRTWVLTQQLAESNKDSFIAILQPVAYIGNSNISYLPEVNRNDVLKKQYEVLYPMIRAEVLKYPEINFLDLSLAFDGEEEYFIDFCHVISDANQIIADELSTITHLE